MKSAMLYAISGNIFTIFLYLVSIVGIAHADKFHNDHTARSLYMSAGSSMAKGGWRPIMSTDTLTAYNFANILGGQTLGSKILTGPAVIETKVISPHIVNVSPFGGDLFSGGIISTSTRPIVTRDANKLTTIAQAYKTSIYPQPGINMNAPVNSYLNPFALPSGPGQYKLNPGFQFDNSMFMKHQPMMNHRPLYNKIPGQLMLGKRLKHNPMQNHMFQQLASNNYHQGIQAYQNNMKKPINTYQQPEAYKRPSESHVKANVNNQKHVNPQESLQTQTKSKNQNGHNVAAVTYKPPYNNHFQQFGVNEEPFGPIPSSILGSFTSFGHASIKARDPSYLNKNNVPSSTTTKAPQPSTEIYSALSTDISKVKVSPPQEIKFNISHKQPVKNYDYGSSLTPPPQASRLTSVHYKDSYSSKDAKSGIKGNFIPSPPDPLSKHQNAPEILKPIKVKTSEYNQQTKRPEITSFFDSASTLDPINIDSTDAVPENLLVQLPPPYVKTTYHGQPVNPENIKSFSSYDDVKYFPPTAGHEFFGSKYKNEVKDKNPYKSSYEVTENWGSSGETNTQPTPYTWISPGHSYKQYNTGLKPPPPSFNVLPTHEDRLIPLSYSPHSKHKKPVYPDVSNVYSTIRENNKQKPFFTQLENTISSIEADIHNKRPMGDEEFDLAAPVNITYNTEERPRSTATPIFEEELTTQQYHSKKRIPARNNNYLTTTTESPDDDFRDFTTRYETYKEMETDTPQQSELPTLAPNKFFKRPVTTTITYSDSEDSVTKKKNKNRRRRPYKPSVTTDSQEQVTYTDSSSRGNKYRATESSDVEEVTRIPKPKARYPSHRTRLTTRPTNQSELTSSAQPTMIPTVPVTIKPRLHSRVRATTLSPLDFDDSMESTTIKANKQYDNSYQQSSIMKIANRTPVKSNFDHFETMKETHDYSHKQDEKDTPTSDISINTYKYSAQTLKADLDTEEPQSESTSPLSLDDIAVESSQTTRSHQFTEQKLGNRGNTKDPLQQQESQDDGRIVSTTPTSFSKPNRHKLPGKYDSNRPRFSVKDYRNRLNQYSSTTTEKPSHVSESSVISSRLRFPNRSRFPSFKEHYGDSKAAGSNLSTSTELPRKKFTPKDPRHKGSSETEDVDVQDKAEEKSPEENEIVTKTPLKLRNGIKRVRTSTTTEVTTIIEMEEKNHDKLVNTYTNLKRPSPNIRKRLPPKNETEDLIVSESSISSTSTTDNSKEVEDKTESSTEKYTSETAIMKIAKEEKKPVEDHTENSTLDQSQRVSDLTLAASKEYNSSGLFKSVSPNSRRVPNYFTIATDDPILPIEAFFPQLNQKKDP